MSVETAEKVETRNELRENIWAVISERGCEGLDLTYTDAAALMRKLSGEDVYGLCVVTSDAARRELQRQSVE